MSFPKMAAFVWPLDEAVGKADVINWATEVERRLGGEHGTDGGSIDGDFTVGGGFTIRGAIPSVSMVDDDGDNQFWSYSGINPTISGQRIWGSYGLIVGDDVGTDRGITLHRERDDAVWRIGGNTYTMLSENNFRVRSGIVEAINASTGSDIGANLHNFPSIVRSGSTKVICHVSAGVRVVNRGTGWSRMLVGVRWRRSDMSWEVMADSFFGATTSGPSYWGSVSFSFVADETHVNSAGNWTFAVYARDDLGNGSECQLNDVSYTFVEVPA